MSWKTICSQIDPSCLKRYFTKSEYKRIKKTAIRVNSTDLYREFGDGMTYKEFRGMLKEHLYYDKLVCRHGIEFYYYVKFNTPREENIPYDDILYTIYAMGGKNV